MSSLAFSLLGPVRAWRDGLELQLGSPQQRTTLAVLLLRGSRITTTEDLVDALWPDAPPETAVGTVRTYLSRLRRTFGGAAEIEWGEPGRPGDDGHTGRRVRFTLQRLVAGHLLAARQTAHGPYPRNPDLTG